MRLFTRSMYARLLVLGLIGLAVALRGSFTRTVAQSSGPVAAFGFSESSGTRTADATGNGNTGTLLGAVTRSAGYFGNGVSLDGTSDGTVQVPMSARLAAVSSAFTLEAWVYPTDVSTPRPIIDRRDGLLRLYLNMQGKPVVYARLGTNDAQIASPGEVTLNTWTHLAATYDGAVLKLLVNAKPVASLSVRGSLPATTQPYWFGRLNGATYAGGLDEIRIYARSLATAEVALDRITPVDAATPFQIGAVTPVDHAFGVLTTPITVGLTRPADRATVSANTIELRDSANALVPSTVSYNASTHTATLTPSVAPSALTDYMVRVAGGTGGIRDADGHALAADLRWTFRTAAAPTSPVAAYAFSESGGTTTADGSANGNTGTLVGPVTRGAGYAGNGVSLDGVSDGRVQVPMSETLAAVADAFTLEAWVSPTDVSTARPILDRHDGDLMFYLTAQAKPVIAAVLNGNSYKLSAPSGVSVNRWTHIAATYDGVHLRLFINAIQVASLAATGSLQATLEPYWFGNLRQSTYAGALDEVRIYRTALGVTDIAIDMTTPVDRASPFAVSGKTPADGALGVLATPVTASFNLSAQASTVTPGTFELRDSANSVIPASVSYDAPARRATLTPASALRSSSTYTARVIGGQAGVRESAGAVLPADVTWTFTTAAVAGPHISAAISPTPNGAGWNSSDVTVTFICTPASSTAAAITSCTPPVTLTNDGANIVVQGEAVDADGTVARTIALVSIDRGIPALAVTSPRDGAVIPSGTTTVQVKGNLVDRLSGPASVTCEGSAATLVGQNFSCNVFAREGTNTVHMVAYDRVGLSASRDLTFVVADVLPSSIDISPAFMTIFAGTRQPLNVVDDLRRTVSGGTWTTTDETIAQIVVQDGVASVQGISEGRAILTLNFAGLTATVTVNVLAEGSNIRTGTTLWSLSGDTAPANAQVLRAVPVARVDDLESAALFFVDKDSADVRATTADGRQLWSYTAPGPVKQVAADNDGGVILNLVPSGNEENSLRRRLQRLDGATGQVSWTYLTNNSYQDVSEVAVHPEGAVYFVEKLDPGPSGGGTGVDAQLVGLAAETGQEDLRVTLGHNTEHLTTEYGYSIVLGDGTIGGAVDVEHHEFLGPISATHPIITDEGTTVVVGYQHEAVTCRAWTAGTPVLPCDDFTEWSFMDRVLVFRLLGRSLASQQVVPSTLTDFQRMDFDHLSRILPDGLGGWVLPTDQRAMIYRVDDQTAVSGPLDLPYHGNTEFVLGDDGVTALVQDPQTSWYYSAHQVTFDPASMTIGHENTIYDFFGYRPKLAFALEGGSIAYSDGPWALQQVAPGLWAGYDGPSLMVGGPLDVSNAGWPYASGSLQTSNVSTRPARGVFIKGHIVSDLPLPSVLEYHHASIRIVPSHQARWLSDSQWGGLFQKDPLTDGPYYVTIGAASHLPFDGLCQFGKLTEAFNREADRTEQATELEQLPVAKEDDVIRQLLEASATYRNDLDYNCFPLAGDNFYNSNGFVAGLLTNRRLPLPLFPIAKLPFFPGWIKPVPSWHFQ